MLILTLIDVQYSQKAVFSFEKGSDGYEHSSSGSQFSDSPHSLLLFGKTCDLLPQGFREVIFPDISLIFP